MGRAREAMLATGLAALALYLFWGYGPLDDDYIVYRYGAQWLEAGQLTYNTDQFVEGYTTPLWLLVITAAMALGLEPDLASQFLGILALLGCVGLLMKLCARTFPGRRPWPALLAACMPALAFHGLGGLGTLPLAFLVLAWANAWQAAAEARRPPLAAALWLALACLMRAECVLLLPGFLWGVSSSASSSRLKGLGSLAGIALLPVLAWSVFRWSYYGEWLPNTYFTKRLPLGEELGYGLRYLWSSTLNSGVGLWLCLLLPLAWRAGDVLLRGLAQGVLLHSAYVVLVGGDYIDLARFFVPTLPLMLFLAWARLGVSFGKRRMVIGLVGVLCALLALQPYGKLAHKKEVYANNEGRWKLVGRVLASTYPEHLSVTLSPIGCVGYLSGLPVVDPLGLVHDAFRELPPDPAVTLKGHQRHDADWVFEQAPAILIPSNARLVPDTAFFSLTWELDLLQHPELASNYRLIALPVEGSYPLVHYLRNDVALPAGARSLIPR